MNHDDPYPDWSILVDRPLDLLALLDLFTVEPDWCRKILPDKVGAAGYSMGGTTALMLGGAKINPQYYLEWCSRQHNVSQSGRDIKRFAAWWEQLAAYRAAFDPSDEKLWSPFTDVRIKAVLAMAPWGAGVSK